ncbi:MAG: FKBP-type peptidyl-prolyl cis-trans isomerase [Salinivirgaceae bacterium]|jgi:FKBP-type peptidyl-prolyl cis-trans isomerase FkpA|nr:FKBP-type peptidyl-prolyl cis-trans isomerase [Salinivirgaceae bacterium]
MQITKTFFVILMAGILLFSCKSQTKNYTAKEKKEFHNNLVKANKGLVTKDQELIESYAKHRNWNMQKSKTGLWYEIIKTTNAPKAKPGQVAHIRYQINLLDGTSCYTSDSLGVKQFKIGQGGVESGLEEAILLLSEGDAARFIMPPHLAHGLLGDENKIPPHSTIVYNVELLKLTD